MARTPTPSSMLALPSLTMPSSSAQDSSRETWKYRSAASTAWSMTRPSMRSSRESSRPPGARMVRRARARLSEVALMRCPSDMGCPSGDSAPEDAMFKGREFAPHAGLARQVDLPHCDALAGRQLVQHRAPAIDHHAVAIGAAAVGMLTDLRRNHKMAEVFDGPRAHQHIPVCAPGGHGECGR